MMHNTKTTDQLNALVRLCNEIIAEPDTAAKNAQIIKAGLLALCNSESAPAPSSSTNEHYEEPNMSRAEAVRILMQLQEVEARAGHPNINEALEMAIRNIVKRHRDACRYKAKRRAALMAEAASSRVAPLSPEAELAATIARQKEEA